MDSRFEMDAILDEVGRGRTEAFGRIVRDYALPLRSFLASQVHHLDDVDDLAQEVFLAALESLPKFRRGDDFGAWLRGIARNKLLSYFRSSARRVIGPAAVSARKWPRSSRTTWSGPAPPTEPRRSSGCCDASGNSPSGSGGSCGPGWTATSRRSSPTNWPRRSAWSTTCTTAPNQLLRDCLQKEAGLMDQDLRDLFALPGWATTTPATSGATPCWPASASDAAFRQAFVDEIRLLGMLKAVQSAGAALAALEDEIGWSAGQPEEVEVLAATGCRGMGSADAESPPATLVDGGSRGRTHRTVPGFSSSDRKPMPPRASPTAETTTIATVIQLDGVEWETGDMPLRDGEAVSPRRLRLRAGRLTLAFFSGVSLTVEGPADLELLAADRLVLPPRQAADTGPARGRRLHRPDGELRDRRFGHRVRAKPGDRRQVAGDGLRGRGGGFAARQGWPFYPRCAGPTAAVGRDRSGRHGIRELPPSRRRSFALGEFVPAPLELTSDYAAEILATRPWGYRRFESLVDGRVPNEVADGPALKALGGVALERSPGGSCCWAALSTGRPYSGPH